MNFLQVDFYDPEVLQKPHKEAKRKKFYCQESNEMKKRTRHHWSLDII